MAAKINPNSFIHEMDRRALENLKAIPGFAAFTKAVMKIYSSHVLKIINLSSKVRLSPEQCPRIYNYVLPACEKFGVPVPEVYLELNRSPNAYVQGDDDVYVCLTITSGLLEIMDEEQVKAVIAHEVGHILCRHVLYTTIAQLVMEGLVTALGLGELASEALKIGFQYWQRCSELSADRAAALYCGDANPVVDFLLHLAGGSDEFVYHELNRELFIAQGEEYSKYVNTSKWNKLLEFLEVMELDHPFLGVRAKEVLDFAKTKTFTNLVNKLNGVLPLVDKSHCKYCGAPVKEGHKFCQKCGKPVDGD